MWPEFVLIFHSALTYQKKKDLYFFYRKEKKLNELELHVLQSLLKSCRSKVVKYSFPSADYIKKSIIDFQMENL